jgi:hypothetical protein
MKIQHVSETTTYEHKVLAQYIADMLLELRAMSKGTEFSKLRHLLELGFSEAFTIANRVQVPLEELEKLEALTKAAKRA